MYIILIKDDRLSQTLTAYPIADQVIFDSNVRSKVFLGFSYSKYIIKAWSMEV